MLKSGIQKHGFPLNTCGNDSGKYKKAPAFAFARKRGGFFYDRSYPTLLSGERFWEE